ncbi:efflux RND transporter periplasmic adaptor subunit [Dyella flava]|uniref:Efflux RND transporter periplasmic adaptor subunit n=1 Tax=Dyella flava TaxID=1920170 RepID=A0ABS2K4Q0_9GAMM|nr:efflux RND transporter periplasmic adaptor subunit [Dyella flava]MBM7125288.1 efflux RND transporter periplasmic adaptor subunit [Dyella flava]GLQ50665.1 secretion protein HlyD [Dyella flava]
MTRLRPRKFVFVAAVVVCTALVIGGVPRLVARGKVARQTQMLSKPTVSVVTPTRAPAQQLLVLPGDIQAYQRAGIYARTSGYLKHWYADIGTHVKSGQLLADIEAPEIDAQLDQARSDAAMASANYQIAKVTAERWEDMLSKNAVSKQSAEENESIMQAKQATLAAALDNVKRLEQLQSYEKVYAPFDGVITVRNVDVGALIDAGNSGPPAALFELAETDRLRIFVDVPQDDAAYIAPGTKAQLTLPQYPGRSFAGTVARTAGAIDPRNRTLRVEVDMANPDGTLLPGAFAQVSLTLTSASPGLSLPANTLLFRPQGVQVAVVDASGVVRLRTVTLGRDFGTRVEIRSGLTGSEQVVVNPSDAISAGQAVSIDRQPSPSA